MTVMDDAPARTTMRGPNGETVMVLDRDIAEFEARGFEVMSSYPEAARAAPQLAGEEAGDSGAMTGSGSAAPLVRRARARKPV